RYDAATGSFSAWYFEHRLPIEPTRYAELLSKIVDTAGAAEEPPERALLALADRSRGPRSPPRAGAPPLQAQPARTAGAARLIERGLAAYRPASGHAGALLALHHLLDRQHYLVAYWRLASNNINYRRFFDVNNLAGLRVDDRATFESIHRLVIRLVGEGC